MRKSVTYIHPSPSEKNQINTINHFCQRMNGMYKFFLNNGGFNDSMAKLRSVSFTDKNNGKEYGYYGFSSVGQLHIVLQNLKIKSLIDLGCGTGVTLSALQSLEAYEQLAGIEKEGPLCELAMNIFHRKWVSHGDILKIGKYAIKYYDAIFLYDPLKDEYSIKKFYDNLHGIISKKQKIILQKYYMSQLLAEHKGFIHEQSFKFPVERFEVFRKK